MAPGRLWWFLVGAVVLLAFAARQPGARAAPVTYAPGWNLVAGPEGSLLQGAVGQLFTLQPGDAAYQALPATSALKAGWGYWAYFPSGGSLQATAGAPQYLVTLQPGEWAMLGNPSATEVAAIAGAERALTYGSDDGYQPTTSVAVGQGVWVQAAGAVSLIATPSAVTPAQGTTPTPVAPLARPGAVYTGLLSPRGSVSFTVSADGTSVSQYRVADAGTLTPSPVCQVELAVGGPLSPPVPITDNAFTIDASPPLLGGGSVVFTGRFASGGRAEGTVQLRAPPLIEGVPPCDTGALPWTAGADR